MRAQIEFCSGPSKIICSFAIIVVVCKVSQVHSGTDLDYDQRAESKLVPSAKFLSSDDEGPEEQTKIDLGVESQPTIDLNLVRDNDDDDDDGDGDGDGVRHHEDEAPAESISGATDLEQPVSSGWCNVDAELDGHCRRLIAHNYSGSLEICGSDGQLYESICDFRRRSCVAADDHRRHPHHHRLLRLESKSFCRETNRGLPASCPPDEYKQFKLALLHEFNGDLGLMFKHFDANGNNLIEARELWPTATGLNWPAENCDDERHCKGLARDFVFWRHFDWSSCSLSHLLLLENATSFEWPRFEATFSSQAIGFAGTGAGPGGEQQQQQPIESTRRRVRVGLGESSLIGCLPDDSDQRMDQHEARLACMWTRYGANVAALRDGHLSLVRDPRRPGGLSLRLVDAQLYLGGPYKCSCSPSGEHSNKQQQQQHLIEIQVLAKARVSVRPQFQWSLPESRVAFECQHDFIDTSFGLAATKQKKLSRPETVKINEPRPADYQLNWWYEIGESDGGERLRILDNKEQAGDGEQTKTSAPSSSRASILAASGRLVLERAQVNDSGRYYCQVDQLDSLNVPASSSALSTDPAAAEITPAGIIMSQSNFGTLLIQPDAQTNPLAMAQSKAAAAAVVRHLWSFHENGVSIYRLRPDESQDLELVRELPGRSQVSSGVEGNWKGLSLCGGDPESEQVFVACEWSDNALLVEVPMATPAPSDDGDRANLISTPTQKYIYIGQPNLDRVVVMDGHAHEVVAIINTEPQPRKLFVFKPNKIHLSKWVRRRLSPMANARWLKAIDDAEQQQQHQQQQQQQQQFAADQLQQSRAHPLELTPKSSRLYSDKRPAEAVPSPAETDGLARKQRRRRRQARAHQRGPEQPQPKLVQHDIWLLCYGRPLDIVEPPVLGARADDSVIKKDNQAPQQSSSFPTNSMPDSASTLSNWPPPSSPLVSTWPLIGPHWRASNTERGLHETPLPPPFAASSTAPQYRANKEARLRNRKSVQIIQSTFFPPFGNPAMHQHRKQQQQQRDQIDPLPSSSSPTSASQAVGRFKRLTVLTTHYVIANHGMSSIHRDNGHPSSLLDSANETNSDRRKVMPAPPPHGPQFDLVQSLSVPQVPYSQQSNPKFKLHHAYVTHYDQRQLYRIAMDGYHYDREIDLQNCDPLSLVLASQGLIIVQCRSPITHKLIGQLVLDELSSRIIGFNNNIQAHESCLTPDNRYLISIHTNQSSTIYVQSVKVDGLSLLYVIETALETTQCSFVWRDGYYAAIFVSINRRDKQSDLLSLRIADSRLELIVRVPGLMTSSGRHKEPLNVEPELQIVTLSTDSGVHVIDLEENRIVQSIEHHHQLSSPTLLWV